jgi:flagellar motility protein MotE (MotC chaperone)
MKRLTSRLRVLPMLIGAASLLLVVKVGSVWTGVQDAARPTLAMAVANAAEPRQGTALPPSAPAADALPAPARQAPAGSEPDPGSGPESQAATVEDRQSRQTAQLTGAELDVLQQLTERRKVLDQREGALAERLSLLQAAETRIDQKIQDLKDLRATLEQLTRIRDDQEEMKILSLVKIYETMKPKDAARIFQELEMETLLLVVDRMKERKLAPVMAEMNPNKAMEVTVELSRLRQMPQLSVDVDG